MDLSKASEITIDYDNLSDLLGKRTGNILAEEEIPEALRGAIKANVKVIVTQAGGTQKYRLLIGDEGNFVISQFS